MKKNWIIGISVFIVVMILGTIMYFVLNPKQNNLIEITGTELLTKLEQKETFILLVSQEGCSHCEEYKPVLNRVLTENNIRAYELNLTNLRKDEELNKKFSSLFNIDGTPTTIFINEGTEKTTINRLVGTKNYNSLVKSLKERGFIE